MTHPRSIITNLKFTYADQTKKLSGMLRYFQYRDNKSEHIPQIDENGRRVPRWVDHGLGDGHRAILDNCTRQATTDLKREVGSRLMVIGPEVGMMHAVPKERRVEVLKELTEATMELWFERMELPTPDYSFTVHESQPGDERPDGRLKDDGRDLSYLHSHVVIAPTVPGLVEARETYRVYEKQVRWLHEAGREAMASIWERELGPERYAELQAELAERDRCQRELDMEHERRDMEAAFAASRAPEPELGIDDDELDRGLELAE